jgi:hypothetical protein
MVCNTQNHWVCGLDLWSGILNKWKTFNWKTFRKLDLFLSSGKGRETTTLLDSLERYYFLSEGCCLKVGEECIEWNCNANGGDNLCHKYA